MDDVKNKQLRLEDVRAARKEEVEYMQRRGIWKIVDEKECWGKQGKGPGSVKWVDTDKGIDGKVNVQSRLVATDFKVKGEGDRQDLFAATPPVEGLRVLISRAPRCWREARFERCCLYMLGRPM